VGLRLLSSLLTEMDGLELATGVLVLAATNRPWALDPALLRPGRFDHVVFVGPPSLADRREILAVHTRGLRLGADVDAEALAAATEGYSGAELAMLCREAALGSLREDMSARAVVGGRHFAAALEGMRPGITPGALEEFEAFRESREGPGA